MGVVKPDSIHIRGRDIIKTYTILSGFVSVDLTDFSSFWESMDLSGHLSMLAKLRVNTTLRKQIFAVQIVDHWNKLPNKVVLAINSFKSLLGKAWSNFSLVFFYLSF